MDYYEEIIRNLVFRSIQKETRLSERQVVQLRWSQIDGDRITTIYGREVQISPEIRRALDSMRKISGNTYVFMTTSLCPATPKASRWEIRKEQRAERKTNRKHLRLTWD